jgi:hypothetical protein
MIKSEDMKIAIVSMQRNESKYIAEWLAYHMVLGVDKFVIYNHMSTDGTGDIYKKLSKHYDIDVYNMEGWNVHYPMMQHSMDTYRPDFDWVINLDMDEYIFPLEKNTIKEVLNPYTEDKSSALGVYWVFFSSNGHIEDPDLTLPSYTDRSDYSEMVNHHMKPFVKGNGRGGIIQTTNPHVYSTEFGTFDLEGRFIHPNCGLNIDGVPCHNIMRINHYWPRSWEWFKTVKQVRGYTADRPPENPTSVITDEFWHSQNLGGTYDNTIWEKYGDQVLIKIEEIKSKLI